jgi:p-aminobenzoyl-glutamate transporter AbgT
MEHGHEHEGHSVWEEAWAIFTDPAHILPEIAWHLIIELVVITFLYGVVIKRVIIPRLRKDIHKEIDEAHDLKH